MRSRLRAHGVTTPWVVIVTWCLLSLTAGAVAKENTATDARRFPPSYITIEGHENVTPDQWTDPRVCGQCHTRQYEGWNGSMHSNAFKDPVFQALWALGEKTDPKLRNHCGACHTPIGVYGVLDDGELWLRVRVVSLDGAQSRLDHSRLLSRP